MTDIEMIATIGGDYLDNNPFVDDVPEDLWGTAIAANFPSAGPDNPLTDGAAPGTVNDAS